MLGVITDGQLNQRLVATLRFLRTVAILDTNMYEAAKKKGGPDTRKTHKKGLDVKDGHRKARGMLPIMQEYVCTKVVHSRAGERNQELNGCGE